MALKINDILGTPHPTYDVQELKLYDDLFSGGKQVLTQDYIFQHPMEKTAIYTARVKRADYCNYVRMILQQIIDFVYRDNMIVREGIEDRFLNDVDLQGTDINAYMRHRGIRAMRDGHSFLPVDMIHIGADVQSQADVRELGIRPYFTYIDKIQLLNWGIDRYGKLIWAVVYEQPEDPTTASDERTETINIRLWETENGIVKWTLYQAKKSRWTMGRKISLREIRKIDEGQNDMGVIPVVPLYADKIMAFQSDSWIKDLARTQRNILNTNSELEELLRKTAVEILTIPYTGSDEDTGQIFKSSDYALLYNPIDTQGLAPDFITATGRAAQSLFQRLEQQRNELFRNLRQRLINTSASSDGSSGISKQEDFASTSTTLAFLAASLEDAERRAWKLFYKFLGQENNNIIITYPRDFSVDAVERAIDRVDKITNQEVPDSLKQFAMSELAHQMMVGSAPMDEIRRVKMDIMNMKRMMNQNSVVGNPNSAMMDNNPNNV